MRMGIHLFFIPHSTRHRQIVKSLRNRHIPKVPQARGVTLDESRRYMAYGDAVRTGCAWNPTQNYLGEYLQGAGGDLMAYLRRRQHIRASRIGKSYPDRGFYARRHDLLQRFKHASKIIAKCGCSMREMSDAMKSAIVAVGRINNDHDS